MINNGTGVMEELWSLSVTNPPRSHSVTLCTLRMGQEVNITLQYTAKISYSMSHIH